MANTTKCIGCEVTECMFNEAGKHCNLDHICVGNDCAATSASCTCCKNFKSRF